MACARSTARSVDGIAPDDHGRSAAPIDECDARGLRALNDVLVREHVAVRRDDDAGAGATAGALRVVRIAADVHADDRRPDVLDGADDRARIGVERLRRSESAVDGRSARARLRCSDRFEKHDGAGMGISVAETQELAADAAAMLAAMDEARKIREFWFGKLPLSPEELERRMQLWFGGAAAAGAAAAVGRRHSRRSSSR